ncbi:MAG: 30S ribosomal protein S21 [Patescibacteria group bacterium]
MPLEIKKKEGETTGSFMFRFNKRVQRSGLVKEVRKRQFKSRAANRTKRRSSALYRIGKKSELAKAKKYGA